MNLLKVLFPLIKAGSGSDIFTYNLASGLNNSSVTAGIQYLPSWSGYIPSLASRLYNLSEYDIIHSNTWNGFAFSGDTPLVATEHLVIHDPIYNPYKTRGQRLYHRLIRSYEEKTLKRADAIVAVSEYVRRAMKTIFGDCDVGVIYNGIDEKKFHPFHVEKTGFINDQDITLLLYTGNTSLRKGSDLLPKIMKRLGDRYQLLTTAGLRSDSCSDQENIIHLGKLTEIELIRVYNACDIFLFPTRLEGFGLSVAEAMACGKPVVSTNGSSIPELVLDGKGGYLCDIDDIPSFVSAIQLLGEDENLRYNMGKKNRSRVCERFTLKRMTYQYIDLYKRVTE
jgi:glycosyltransferase involved in cell wall biosynthesis